MFSLGVELPVRKMECLVEESQINVARRTGTWGRPYFDLVDFLLAVLGFEFCFRFGGAGYAGLSDSWCFLMMISGDKRV